MGVRSRVMPLICSDLRLRRKWWQDPESNRGHKDFQLFALLVFFWPSLSACVPTYEAYSIGKLKRKLRT